MVQRESRVALVTGASKGIGAAVATRLARDGHLIAVNYLTDAVGAERVLGEIQAAGGEGILVQADIGTEDGPPEAVEACLRAFGRVDIVVNNAAVFPLAEWDHIEVGAWDRVFAVNVRGGYLVARAAAPSMVARGWGRIIFVSSGTFLTGSSRLAHYAASKGAVVGLTRSLALALGDHGVTVNAVTTGRTLTEGLQGIFGEGDLTMEGSVQSRSSQAVKRLAVPEDLVGTFAFLASDDSSYMTGQLLNVDGGRNMH